MAAGDAVVKGSTDFTEVHPRRRWVRNRGWVSARVWQGPLDDTKIATQVATLQAASAEEIEIDEDWPTTITAVLPTENDTISVGIPEPDTASEWTLEPYDLNKELGTHGKFNGSGSSGTILAQIDADLKSGVAYGKDYNTDYSLPNMNTYALLKGQGVTDYLAFGYVLRRVITCERENIFTREYQNISENQGKIVKWATIGVPDSANIEKPWLHMYVSAIWANFVYKAGSAGGWADVYFEEWMVKPPSIRFTREGRVRKRQLVQEYIGAIGWSSTLYDGGTITP